jgi:predicted DNA repair protein MutK
MPSVLSTLSWVGVVAMLWVGGHILLVGADELGLHAPYDWVHHVETAVHDATGGLGAALGWLTNTFFSAVLGLVVGAVVVTVVHLLPFGRKPTGQSSPAESEAAGESGKVDGSAAQ